MNLTPKQKAFADEYIKNGGNASDAARKAGYAERSVRVTGTQNLTNPNISAYIAEKQSLIEKQKQMTRWWGYQELDQYLQDGDDSGKINWEQKFSPDRLQPFDETHPQVIQAWINERRDLVQSGLVN